VCKRARALGMNIQSYRNDGSYVNTMELVLGSNRGAFEVSVMNLGVPEPARHIGLMIL
jgi:hypothetical protein